jgi:hypothetical protein
VTWYVECNIWVVESEFKWFDGGLRHDIDPTKFETGVRINLTAWSSEVNETCLLQGEGGTNLFRSVFGIVAATISALSTGNLSGVHTYVKV